MFEKIKSIFKINHRVVRAEIEEVKSLNITEDDKRQAQELAVLVAAGLAACGIPVGVIGQNIIAHVLAYALRDLKDGVESNDKLIINRVVCEIEAEKIAKKQATTRSLYKNINK